MRPSRRILLGVVLVSGIATSARAQGWDYGRNMFGFAQSTPGLPWTGQYHPGDGRPGILYVYAGNGNYYGDPKGRPLVMTPNGAALPPRRRVLAHGRR